MTPQEVLLTPVSGCHLTITECRRIFPAGWREKFFLDFRA